MKLVSLYSTIKMMHGPINIRINNITKCQSHGFILHQHVSVNPVTPVWVAYDKNTISIQINVQKYVIKPLGGLLQVQNMCNIIHFEQLFLN